LITDVAGLKVGNSQVNFFKTGSTVLVGDVPFTASVHVMGGAPGTKETDLLAPDKTVDKLMHLFYLVDLHLALMRVLALWMVCE